MGDPDEAAGSWIQPGPSVAVAVNQCIEDLPPLSFPLSNCPLFFLPTYSKDKMRGSPHSQNHWEAPARGVKLKVCFYNILLPSPSSTGNLLPEPGRVSTREFNMYMQVLRPSQMFPIWECHLPICTERSVKQLPMSNCGTSI